MVFTLEVLQLSYYILMIFFLPVMLTFLISVALQNCYVTLDFNSAD